MNSRLKSILCVVLAVSFLAGSMTASANDAPQGITVLVDGNSVTFDQEPRLINGRVMVPIRAVAEAMGWEVRSNSPTVIEIVKAVRYTDGTRNYLFSLNSITIDLEHERIDRRIAVGVGRSFETEADKNIKLTAKPAVINGRTLVGVRDLAECLYATVEWDGAAQTVIITSGEVPYYDGYGLPNRDELFEQMRVYYNAGATLTRIGEPLPQTTAPANQSAAVVSEAPEVGSFPANILLPGKTDVHSADSYYEPYKIRVGYGCNWYAFGRFYEVHGYQNPVRYTGGANYLDTVEAAKSDVVRAERDLSKIAAGSIAVYWRQKNGGHVVFIEYVERGENGNPTHVYYTEAMNTDGSGTYRPASDGRVKKAAFERFKKSSSGTKDLMGYVIPR